jgi:hypothetical protein
MDKSKAKNIALMILAKSKPKKEVDIEIDKDSDESDEIVAAEKFLKAIEKKDAAMLAEAFKELKELCSPMNFDEE